MGHFKDGILRMVFQGHVMRCVEKGGVGEANEIDGDRM